jgi:hypothetical protein
LYIDIKRRARLHSCIVFCFIVFYSISYIQPDDGYKVQLKHVALFTCMKKWCADCNPTSFLYILRTCWLFIWLFINFINLINARKNEHVKKSVQSYLDTVTKQLHFHILFLDHAKHEMSECTHSLTSKWHNVSFYCLRQANSVKYLLRAGQRDVY